MSKRLFVLGAVVIATALSTGCASVQMASAEKDAAAKTFAVTPNKANIYVYRNESMGAAVKMPVALNGRLVGDTAAKTYMRLEVPAGEHMVVSKAENDASIAVKAEAGKNYFVWQEVKMGMFAARTALHLVDDKTGKSAVQECKLIEQAQGIAY